MADEITKRVSKIQWTGRTWQVTSGCKEWSPGCLNCYARRDARRMGANPNEKVRKRYAGLVVVKNERLVWSGEVRELPEQLAVPLRWSEPQTVFVNSLSDLAQEGVSFEFIAAVFGVMAMCSRHSFQVLTKRPDRLRAWFEWLTEKVQTGDEIAYCVETACELIAAHAEDIDTTMRLIGRHAPVLNAKWPLANVSVGTSVEDQKRADERVPELLRTPARVRYLSVEPILGAIQFKAEWLKGQFCGCPEETHDYTGGGDRCFAEWSPRLDLVIVGGESGPEARPDNVAWIRGVVEQCVAAGTKAFVKQLGAVVIDRNDVGFEAELVEPPDPEAWPTPVRVEENLDGTRDGYQGAPVRVHLRDKKGGDMSEWPAGLRVRELPDGWAR
jgi:protein gp37